MGGDNWTSQDVPLGEESERYVVELLIGGEVVLAQEVHTPSLQIPISELEVLSGTVLFEITISIAQLSQTFGRGASRAISIEV